MEKVPAGVPLSFEVTFEAPDLNVGMTVFDDSGVLPVLLLSPFPMVLVYGNTYRAKFTAQNGKSYIINKAVYTDNTLTVIDTEFPQGSESCIASFESGSDSCFILGIVDLSGDVIGLVNC